MVSASFPGESTSPDARAAVCSLGMLGANNRGPNASHLQVVFVVQGLPVTSRIALVRLRCVWRLLLLNSRNRTPHASERACGCVARSDMVA